MVYKRHVEHCYFHKEIACKGQKTKNISLVAVDCRANVLMLIWCVYLNRKGTAFDRAVYSRETMVCFMWNNLYLQ